MRNWKNPACSVLSLDHALEDQLYWKLRRKWTLIYKKLQSDGFGIWRWYQGAGTYCSYYTIFFYFFISLLQWIAFISNTSISKRRPTRVSVHSLTSCHFRICRFQTQDQAVIQNIVVSTEQSLGVFQSNVMSYSTCRGGRGVRLIFQSTDHWHTIEVIQPSVRGRTREEKGTAFYAFPNYMFAELKGKEAGNVIIYQLPLSVCCTLEDISATLFIKKKEVSLLNSNLERYPGTGHTDGRTETSQPLHRQILLLLLP